MQICSACTRSGRSPMTFSGALRDRALQEAVISACRELTRLGLTYGTSGNIGLRRDERHFFVSPTGMSYDALEPGDIPLVDLDGRWFGRRLPSSEWRLLSVRVLTPDRARARRRN